MTNHDLQSRPLTSLPPLAWLRGMSARRCVLILSLGLFAGCNDMPTEPSLLDGPRFLAIQSEPRGLYPGTDQTLFAIGHELTEPLTWSVCDQPWVPAEVPLCPSVARELPATNPTQVSVPEGASALYVLAESEGAISAVLTMASTAPAPHPAIVSVQSEGEAMPQSVVAGGTLSLEAILDDPLGGGDLVTSWFVTDGRFVPWRTVDSDVTTLELPATEGTLKIVAIVRDRQGGVGSFETTLDVTP